MEKSAKEYIAEGDFEGAKTRFDTTTCRWKIHWFNACKEIFDKNKEWAKKYILNPMKLTITKIIDYLFERNHNSNVYFVKLLGQKGKPLCLKIGKANCIDDRLTEYVRRSAYYYDYELIKSWKLPSAKDAESFEKKLQARVLDTLVPNSINIPHDRFELFEVTQDLLDKMDKVYNNYLKSIEQDALIGVC